MTTNTHSNQKASEKGVIDSISGIVAGFFGKIVEHPFDTVKVNLQSQVLHKDAHYIAANFVKYNGAWDCFCKIIQRDGLVGLYRGLSLPLIGSIVETSVLFTVFGQINLLWLKHIPREKDILSLTEVALSGAISGFAVSWILTPVELIKSRLQIQQNVNKGSRHRKDILHSNLLYNGVFDCAKKSIQSEGWKVLFKGQIAMIMREIPAGAAWFTVYEACIRMVNPRDTHHEIVNPNPTTIIFAGSLAGIANWLAFYPADTVKAEIQTKQTHLRPHSTIHKATHKAKIHSQTFAQVFLSIYRQSGIKGLYRGVHVSMMQGANSTATAFLSYETMSNLLNKLFH